MQCDLFVNGFAVHATFADQAVQEIFVPILHHLAELQKQKGERLIAFLAAPPATGKSTLAAFLQKIANELPHALPVQGVGMDGFHYPKSEIDRREVVRNGKHLPMYQFKGAPDTFDVARLHSKLIQLQNQSEVLWPFYDRRVHDVVENAVRVTAPIVLVEGNYLLLDAPAWRDLPHDYSVFIEAEEAQLRSRLIARKIRGGLDKAAAEAFYDACDGANVRLCLEKRLPADITLRMKGDGCFVLKGEGHV